MPSTSRPRGPSVVFLGSRPGRASFAFRVSLSNAAVGFSDPLAAAPMRLGFASGKAFLVEGGADRRSTGVGSLAAAFSTDATVNSPCTFEVCRLRVRDHQPVAHGGHDPSVHLTQVPLRPGQPHLHLEGGAVLGVDSRRCALNTNRLGAVSRRFEIDQAVMRRRARILRMTHWKM